MCPGCEDEGPLANLFSQRLQVFLQRPDQDFRIFCRQIGIGDDPGRFLSDEFTHDTPDIGGCGRLPESFLLHLCLQIRDCG